MNRLGKILTLGLAKKRLGQAMYNPSFSDHRSSQRLSLPLTQQPVGKANATDENQI